MGFQSWDELAGLTPAAGGRFDSGGLNLGGAVHWRLREWGSRSLLVGLDSAMFSNESDVPHIREDLMSRGFYLTPSVKLMFDAGTGPRYAADVGLGYYVTDLAEVELFSGGYAESQLWEDAAFGGYVGASMDFGPRDGDRRGGFSMSAKVHFFDLGEVGDEGAAVLFGTLGSNPGSLSGPVVMLQFGYHGF